MSAWEALESMLETDPRDAGCAETFELIHAYAEIVVNGGDPEAAMPGITVHLESCGPALRTTSACSRLCARKRIRRSSSDRLRGDRRAVRRRR